MIFQTLAVNGSIEEALGNGQRRRNASAAVRSITTFEFAEKSMTRLGQFPRSEPFAEALAKPMLVSAKIQ